MFSCSNVALGLMIVMILQLSGTKKFLFSSSSVTITDRSLGLIMLMLPLNDRRFVSDSTPACRALTPHTASRAIADPVMILRAFIIHLLPHARDDPTAPSLECCMTKLVLRGGFRASSNNPAGHKCAVLRREHHIDLVTDLQVAQGWLLDSLDHNLRVAGKTEGPQTVA